MFVLKVSRSVSHYFFFLLVCLYLFQFFRRLCGRGPPPVRPNFTVLCLGLGKSGKSTLLAKVSGESTDEIEPTVGKILSYLYAVIMLYMYKLTGYLLPIINFHFQTGIQTCDLWHHCLAEQSGTTQTNGLSQQPPKSLHNH